MLRVLPRGRFTVVHPQCTNVGVGGFLLGGGVNFEGPQTAKFGTGAENVVEYQLVDSYGDIVRVTRDRITRRTFHGSEIASVPNEGDNDLFFALKGAGSNFGIVTEFLYRVYPFPETRPVAVPVYLRSIHDFIRLQKVAETGRYQISVYRLQHFRRPDSSWHHNRVRSRRKGANKKKVHDLQHQ